MSKLLEPPRRPPTGRRPTRQPQRWDRDEENESILVGILLTILLWPLLAGGFAWGLQHVHGALAEQIKATPHLAPPKELNIELAPDEPLTPKMPFKFVETNPNVPDNEPNKTDNFAAKNQQAAQLVPDKTTTGDHARLEGKDIPSQQVVVGERVKPEESQPTPPQNQTQQQTAQNTPKEEQVPLPGFEKKEADNPEGIASNTAQVSDKNQPVVEEVKGQKDVPPNGVSANALTTKTMPKPRPRVAQQAPRGILAQNIHGTSNVGPAAYDAKWSEFGDYMQQLVDVVREEWYRLIEQSAVSPPPGSYVAVTFRINSKGEIAEIVKVDPSTAGKEGSYVCRAAITSPAPYRVWTPQMIAVLGEEQVITFTFYYY